LAIPFEELATISATYQDDREYTQLLSEASLRSYALHQTEKMAENFVASADFFSFTGESMRKISGDLTDRDRSV